MARVIERTTSSTCSFNTSMGWHYTSGERRRPARHAAVNAESCNSAMIEMARELVGRFRIRGTAAVRIIASRTLPAFTSS